jgi:hypothetical protein
LRYWAASYLRWVSSASWLSDIALLQRHSRNRPINWGSRFDNFTKEVAMSINALLESGPEAHPIRGEQHYTGPIAATILDHLDEQTVISLDSLVCLMPQYTWNQIFQAVDQLARSNKIVLRRHRFDYMLFSTNFVA